MVQNPVATNTAPTQPPIRIGVAGVGEFGASLAIRDQHVSAVSVCAFADLNVDQARRRLERAGVPRDLIHLCESRAQAMTALALGARVLTPDANLLPLLPLDIVVDSTGHPEAAARLAQAAIANGQHVAMATKECDSVIGPWLARQARDAGVVYTPVDGDQPSLLIKLVAWARLLGLRILGAGKASEFDFVYDPRKQVLITQGRTLEVPALDQAWQLPTTSPDQSIEARAALLAELPRASAPDYCEMAIVANATGLRLDGATLRAPIARTLELPDLFCPIRQGGLFADEGTIDTFNCLRRVDELSFAGGVFVVCDIGDDDTFAVLRAKGIPASRSGSRLLLYNPTHLLGVEALASILEAVRHGRASVDERYRPRYDVVGRATQDLPAGTLLQIGDRHTHTIAGVAPRFAAKVTLAPEQPIPYYLALGRRLARSVSAGQPLTVADVLTPEDSTLWQLRQAQDSLFEAPA